MSRAKTISGGQRFGDISLIVGWSPPIKAHTGPPADSSHALSELTPPAQLIPLADWQAWRIFPNLEPGKFISLSELTAEFSALVARAQQFAHEQAQTDVALYFVFHIGDVTDERNAWKPRLWPAHHILRQALHWLTSRADEFPIDVQKSAGMLAPRLQSATFAALANAIEQASVNVLHKPMTSNVVADSTTNLLAEGARQGSLGSAYFEHYSAQRHQRGYIVLGPIMSLVVDCAEQDVRVLLTLAQQAQLTQDGMSRDDFRDLRLRVSSWDAVAEVRSSIDEQSLSMRSSNASARGQVLLGIQLFAVSTLLGFMQANTLGNNSMAFLLPMVMYSVGSLLYFAYLGIPFRLLDIFGFALLVDATICTMLLFADPSLTLVVNIYHLLTWWKH